MDENKIAQRRRGFKSVYVKVGVVSFCVVAALILFYFLFFRDRTLFTFIKKIFHTLTPFFVGAILAYVLKPMCTVFERWLGALFGKIKNKHIAAKLTESVAILCTMLIFFGLVYLLFAAVIPQVIDSVKLLIETMPETYDKIMKWAIKVSKDTPFEETIINFDKNAYENIEEFLTKIVEIDAGKIIAGFTVGVKGLLGFASNLIIGLVACIYILAQRKTLAKQGRLIVNSIFKDSHANAVMEEFKYIDSVFSGFINGKIIDSIIIGVLTFVITSIFKIPYAVLVSVIVGATNIIPFFGPWIGAAPAGFIVLMADPIKCVYFLIIIIAIQQLDGNVIGPKILGSSTGLSSFWVLFSIVVFGGLYGFMGMLLGVPVFAIIYDVIRRLVRKGLAKHKKGQLYIDYVKEKRVVERAQKESVEHRRERLGRVKKITYHDNDEHPEKKDDQGEEK